MTPTPRTSFPSPPRPRQRPLSILACRQLIPCGRSFVVAVLLLLVDAHRHRHPRGASTHRSCAVAVRAHGPLTKGMAVRREERVVQEMLKDEVRTVSYKNAILKNPHLFKGACVHGLLAARRNHPPAQSMPAWACVACRACRHRQDRAGRRLRNGHPELVRRQGRREESHWGTFSRPGPRARDWCWSATQHFVQN